MPQIRTAASLVTAAATMLTATAAAQTILIDMGPSLIAGSPATTASPDANGNTWNNFTPGSFIRLKDTTGGLPAGTVPEGMGLGGLTPVGSSLAVDEGLQFPAAGVLGDIAIGSATQDFIFRFDNASGLPEILALEMSSVEPTETLNFRFFASRNAGEAGAQTRYTVFYNDIESQSVVLDTTDNVDTFAVISGVNANTNGTIQIEMEAESGSFCYLNVLEITIGDGTPFISFPTQPTSVAVDGGGTITLTADAQANLGGLQLQWRRDGVALLDGGRISGATTETLTIDPAGLADSGEYTLEATLPGLTVASDAAVVAVRTSPAGTADVNFDGVRDVFDIIGFFAAFAGGF